MISTLETVGAPLGSEIRGQRHKLSVTGALVHFQERGRVTSVKPFVFKALLPWSSLMPFSLSLPRLPSQI